MATLLDDSAVFNHTIHIRITNGTEAVGNNNGRFHSNITNPIFHLIRCDMIQDSH